MQSQSSEIRLAIASARNAGGSGGWCICNASRTASSTSCFQAWMRGRNCARSSGFDRLAAYNSACTRTKPEAMSFSS